MVKAVVLLAGLMIDKTEFSVVVSIMDIPINWFVPVAQSTVVKWGYYRWIYSRYDSNWWSY